MNVYRLVTENSIEERIMELQGKKMAVSNAIVNSENSTMYQMGTERLLDIFAFPEKNVCSAGEHCNCKYDLDALMERFADDYKTLSVGDFAKSLLS